MPGVTLAKYMPGAANQGEASKLQSKSTVRMLVGSRTGHFGLKIGKVYFFSPNLYYLPVGDTNLACLDG